MVNDNTSETSIDYYDLGEETDPFPNDSSLDRLDNAKKEDINEGI